MVCETNANGSRSLRVQKGPYLVKDFLSNRSDAIGVDQSNGLAEIARLHGLNDQVRLDSRVRFGLVASSEFSPGGSCLAYWSSGIQRLEVPEIQLVVSGVQMLSEASLGGRRIFPGNATTLG